jgi:hypothetical protein
MNLKQKLFSNMFLRNMLASLGSRSAYTKDPGSFVRYFQYKIGPYQSDQYLYFPKEPYALRYKNEIFNKLHEYTGYDIIRYLEFHYDVYADPGDFLRFLKYEIGERLRVEPKDRALQSAQAYVDEKLDELKKSQQDQMRQDIELVVQGIVNKQPTASPQDAEHYVSVLVQKFTDHMERVTSETEQGIKGLTGSFVTGDIELNNQNHEGRLMQVFMILQELTGKTVQLFKRCTDTDLAAILHLHFKAFKGKKITTVQREIGGLRPRIKEGSPRIKKLNDALEQFFY